ncbi:MAG: Cna B-type domain-containing protein [Clostridia bacterium]|nr:Cna B-type domain-containing protein [Clostridia bacterium]
MKKFRILFTLLILCTLLATTVCAQNARVVFRGHDTGFEFIPGTSYSTTDLFPDFKEVMPGDTFTQKITVSNKGSGDYKTLIYMRALGAHADSEDFLSQLRLKVDLVDADPTNYLFDAPASQTATLTDWVLIGSLYLNGEVDLNVTLEIPKELDTKYQNKIGFLDWEFLAEEYPINPVRPDEPKPPVTPTKKDVNVQVVWVDNDNAYGKRPESVNVELMLDDKTVDKAEINSDGNWTHTFEKVSSGEDFTVVQNTVDGYTTTYSGNAKDGFVITNTYKAPVVPEKDDVHVQIVWVDNNNEKGKRPESVKIDLIADGKTVSSADVTADGLWKHIFEKVSSGEEFSVIQNAVDGYTTEYSGNAKDGFVITNTRIPEVKDIAVEIVWNDNGNEDGKRPESVTVQIISDGKIVGSATLTEENGWKHIFENMDADSEYTVIQNTVDGYTTSYSGNSDSGFIITNDYVEPEEPTPPATGDTTHLPVWIATASISFALMLVLIIFLILSKKREDEEQKNN